MKSNLRFESKGLKNYGARRSLLFLFVGTLCTTKSCHLSRDPINIVNPVFLPLSGIRVNNTVILFCIPLFKTFSTPFINPQCKIIRVDLSYLS